MEANGVRALIDAAQYDADLAWTGLNAAKNIIQDAMDKIRIVRQNSVDPIGLPQLSAMIEKIDEAIKYGKQFKEETSRYKDRL